MKKYTPALIALAAYWEAIHIVLLMKSAGCVDAGDKTTTLFPFNYRDLPGLWAYDITEFIGYTTIALLALSYLIRKRDDSTPKAAWLHIAAFAYCDVIFSYLAFSSNYDVGFLLFSIMCAAVIFAVSSAVFCILWDMVAHKVSKRHKS